MSQFPDFAALPFDAERAAAALAVGDAWETPEGIAVRPAYGLADIAGLTTG